MSASIYWLSALAIIVGGALEMWGPEGSSLPMLLIMAGIAALGAEKIRQTDRKVQNTDQKADKAMEETQTLRKDMLNKD